MPETQVANTFLHEVLHAIGESAGVQYWIHHAYDGNKVTDQIEPMARALLRFMRDNPDTIDWLIKNA